MALTDRREVVRDRESQTAERRVGARRERGARARSNFFSSELSGAGWKLSQRQSCPARKDSAPGKEIRGRRGFGACPNAGFRAPRAADRTATGKAVKVSANKQVRGSAEVRLRACNGRWSPRFGPAEKNLPSGVAGSRESSRRAVLGK